MRAAFPTRGFCRGRIFDVWLPWVRIGGGVGIDAEIPYVEIHSIFSHHFDKSVFAVAQRFEKYIIADDVQVVDVGAAYGLLSVQGPRSETVVRRLEMFSEIPTNPQHFVSVNDATLGEMYLVNQPRVGSSGFDLFVPTPALGAVMDKLIAAAREAGGRACGWRALSFSSLNTTT